MSQEVRKKYIRVLLQKYLDNTIDQEQRRLSLRERKLKKLEIGWV
jgi:hypothetical protein